MNNDMETGEIAQLLEHLHSLLQKAIVPALETIHRNQAQTQAAQESNAAALLEFRTEILKRFVEYHAELARIQAQVDDAMTALGLRSGSQGASGSIVH